MPDHTVPDDNTKDEEEQEAEVRPGADRAPTPDEEAAADSNRPNPGTAKAEQEFNRLGAEVKGEGEIP